MQQISKKKLQGIEIKILFRDLQFKDRQERTFYIGGNDVKLAERLIRSIKTVGGEAVLIPHVEDMIDVCTIYAETKVGERAIVYYVESLVWVTPISIRVRSSSCDSLDCAGGEERVYVRCPSGHWKKVSEDITWIT